MQAALAGKLIVLDGPDGSGKSTQVQCLMDWLAAEAVDAVTYRDPGDTEIGEQIRRILLDLRNEGMSPRTELLLYMAARAQLWAEKMAPALEAGRCVVLDRWVSSTCAYQGYAGGEGVQRVLEVARQCLDRLWPDVTVILDIDPAGASGRMNRPLDRMERKGRAYHRRVREGFLQLAGSQPGFCVVPADGTVDAVHRRVRTAILEVLRTPGDSPQR